MDWLPHIPPAAHLEEPYLIQEGAAGRRKGVYCSCTWKEKLPDPHKSHVFAVHLYIWDYPAVLNAPPGEMYHSSQNLGSGSQCSQVFALADPCSLHLQEQD